MDEGFEYESAGTEVENSSRILLRTEKATRTGYSWSVITTAAPHQYASALFASLALYTRATRNVGMRRTREVTRASLAIAMGSVGVLLDTLSLGRLGAFGDSLGHEGHKLSDGAALVEGKRGEIGRVD